MNYLKEVYKLNSGQIERLQKDGLLPFQVVIHAELFDHFTRIRPFSKSDRDALIDCSIHYGYGLRYCYRIVKRVREIVDKPRKND
jgi:hypothetical protein